MIILCNIGAFERSIPFAIGGVLTRSAFLDTTVGGVGGVAVDSSGLRIACCGGDGARAFDCASVEICSMRFSA